MAVAVIPLSFLAPPAHAATTIDGCSPTVNYLHGSSSQPGYTDGKVQVTCTGTLPVTVTVRGYFGDNATSWMASGTHTNVKQTQKTRQYPVPYGGIDNKVKCVNGHTYTLTADVYINGKFSGNVSRVQKITDCK